MSYITKIEKDAEVIFAEDFNESKGKDPVFSEVLVKARFEQTERVFLSFAESQDVKFGMVKLNLKSVARDYSSFKDLIRDIQICINNHPEHGLKIWHGNSWNTDPTDIYLIKDDASYEPKNSPSCRINRHATCKLNGCTCICHAVRKEMSPAEREAKIKALTAAYIKAASPRKLDGRLKLLKKDIDKKAERYEAYCLYCKNTGQEPKSYSEFEE